MASKRPTFTHEAMVANILATYDVADDAAQRDGADWYPAMFRIMREHAATSAVTVAQASAIYAATSINTPWARNLALASQAIADGGLHAGTLRMVCAKVNAILAAVDADVLTALAPNPATRKLPSFASNLAGDYDAVTVDRWAHRVATNGARSDVPTGALYDAIANAYRDAAAQRGVNPATMQAVTWCVARGSAS